MGALRVAKRLLTAMITLQPAAALEACARRGGQHEVRYQLYTLRTDKSGERRRPEAGKGLNGMRFSLHGTGVRDWTD